MKNLVLLGAGTAGTMVANHMARELDRDWQVTVIDPEMSHLYQPGLLFLPFGARDEDKMVRSRQRTLAPAVRWIQRAVAGLDPDTKSVSLDNGVRIPYDLLVIATGTRIRPDLVEGLKGDHWQRKHFEFYTLSGALALRTALANFDHGRLVLNVAEMPIKCPVAPLEFLFLADAYLRRRGIRERVELVYATPLEGAFTKPLTNKKLNYLLEEKGIAIEPDFALMTADGDSGTLTSYDEREVGYDLLVSIPTHSGAAFVEEAGFGNELAFIPTDRHTLAAKDLADVFVLGDATDLPSSKAGSVAHFQSEVLSANLMDTVAGRSPASTFDGHANCFVETGFGKAMLIDFNYETEPLPGSFPLPGIGPFTLLGESRVNHWGKLGFRWLYWNALLPARPIPVAPQMSLVGKQTRLLGVA